MDDGSGIVCLVLPGNSGRDGFSITGSRRNSARLMGEVLSTLASRSLSAILVNLRTASICKSGLICFLERSTALTPFGEGVRILGPGRIGGFRSTCGSLPGGSCISSFIVTSYLHFNEVGGRMCVKSCHCGTLRGLAQTHFFTIRGLMGRGRQFVGILFGGCSAVARRGIFDSAFDAATLTICSRFRSTRTLTGVSLRRLASFVVRGKGGHFPSPSTMTGTVRGTTHDSCHLPGAMGSSIGRILSVSVASVGTLRSRVGRFSGTVGTRVRLLPGMLVSVPNVKPICSTKVVTRVNSVGHFGDRTTLTGCTKLT